MQIWYINYLRGPRFRENSFNCSHKWNLCAGNRIKSTMVCLDGNQTFLHCEQDVKSFSQRKNECAKVNLIWLLNTTPLSSEFH